MIQHFSVFSDEQLALYQEVIDIDRQEIIGLEREEIKDMNLITLETISDDVLNSTISNQIKNLNVETSNVSNFLDVFETRFNFFTTLYVDEPDIVDQARVIRKEFYNSILNQILKKYQVRYMIDESLLPIITTALFNLFIMEYHSTIVGFILNQILERKEEFANQFKDQGKILTYSKKFKKRSDAVIIANLIAIINQIVNDSNLTYEDIIESLNETDPNEESIFVLNQFSGKESEAKLAIIDDDNDFHKVLFDPIINQREGYTMLIIEIQNRLYQVFPLKPANQK